MVVTEEEVQLASALAADWRPPAEARRLGGSEARKFGGWVSGTASLMRSVR